MAAPMGAPVDGDVGERNIHEANASRSYVKPSSATTGSLNRSSVMGQHRSSAAATRCTSRGTFGSSIFRSADRSIVDLGLGGRALVGVAVLSKGHSLAGPGPSPLSKGHGGIRMATHSNGREPPIHALPSLTAASMSRYTAKRLAAW